MGYSDQQSMQLAKTATMFQNIADAEISAGDAALFINSQLKGFSKEFSAFSSKGEASMHVIDSVNEVANNFAVGTNDLQLALSKTASAMGGFGNSFEQTIGIITAGTEIMVGQPSKVARGWRTIGANITKLAKETDTYRDASGKVEIQMRKQDGTMKNTYEFLTDLHKEWGNLNNEQKTAIALQFGGKNQMEVFMATMNNFDTALRATETAMGAQGSATKENNRYLESMAGHLANLKSAWEELSYKMISSDALKKGMDILAGVLRFLASDAGQVVIWMTALAGALNLVAKAALGLKGLALVKLFSGLGNLGKDAGKAATGVGALSKAFKGLNGKMFGGKGLSAAATTMKGLAKSAGLWGAGILAVSGAIAGGLRLYQKWVEKNDKVIQQDKEATKAVKEWHEAHKDVIATKEKIKKKQSEIQDLESKRSATGLSNAEEDNLEILKLELETEKEILRLQQEREAQKWKKQEQTLGKKGLSASDFVTMGREGWTAQETWENLYGVSTKAGKALVEYQHNAQAARQAQIELDQATEHLNNVRKTQGHTEEDLSNAEKEVEKAQSKLTDAQLDQSQSLQSLIKKKQEYDDYLDKGNKLTDEELKDYKKVNKAIKDNEHLSGLSTKEMKKGMKAMIQYGDAMGVISKDGKKINQIQLGKFTESMLNAGHSVKDVQSYLEEIQNTNPDAKVTIRGQEVAKEDLGAVLQYLEAIDSNNPNAKVTIGDTEYAIQDLQLVDGKLKTIDGKTVTAKVNIDDSGAQGKENKYKGNKKTGTRTVKFKAETASVKNANNTWKGDKKIGTRTVEFKAVRTGNWSTSGGGGGHRAGGTRSFGHFAKGVSAFDNAEVNEQGFEIIQDSESGLMRVVNGGKRGATTLNEGDAVYTHGQSVRMLRNAGLTEGSVVYGHGDKDFGLVGVKKLKGFKSGKNTKKKNQKAYDKKYNAIKRAMESGLSTLEYKKSYYNWTDSEFNAQYKKLFNKQNKALKKLNKSKTAKQKGVKKKTTLGTDIVRAYNLALREATSDKAKKGIESTIANRQGTASDLSAMLKAINAADKAQTISADEAKEYRMEAYKKYVDYNLKQYENDKNTYAKSLALIKDYYKKGQLSGEDYYNYLDDLAKTQLEKEKSRLQEQQDLNENTYSLARAYVQRQIDLLETENEEQEKQNDLIELQNNLAKARNQRVRIYKEGEGFVYEKDTEAIREATNALKEYQSSATSSEEALNPVLVQWQNVLKLFDEFEADYELKALENKVGATVGQLFGSFGTNTGAWSDWIKQNLSTTQGIGDVLTNLDKLVDTNDIIKYLDSNGQVSQSIIDAAIGNNVLPTTYAAAITQMAQGMSAGVNTAANLATQSSITAATSGAVVMGNATQYGNIYNFDNLVLPNVTNANEFIDGLNNLSTTALQTSTQRG